MVRVSCCAYLGPGLLISVFALAISTSYRPSRKKLAATLAPGRYLDKHEENDDSDDSRIIRAGLEVDRAVSISSSMTPSSVSDPTLAGGQISSLPNLSNSNERWECSECTLDPICNSRELVESHIEMGRCGGKPKMSTGPPLNRCQTCSTTFLVPSELDVHVCADGQVLHTSDNATTPMIASTSEGGNQIKARKAPKKNSRQSVSRIFKDGTQSSPSQKASALTEISRTLFDLFACDKCADLENQDDPSYKYPSPSGVQRHRSFRRCDGEAIKALCRPYRVCTRCRRPWFSRKAWLDHSSRGCGGVPVSRPRVSSSRNSVSSKKVVRDDSDEESNSKPQPSTNHITHFSMFGKLLVFLHLVELYLYRMCR